MNETAKILAKMEAKNLPASQVERVRDVLGRVDVTLGTVPQWLIDMKGR